MTLLQILFFSGEECKPKSPSQTSGAQSAFSARRKGSVSADRNGCCLCICDRNFRQ